MSLFWVVCAYLFVTGVTFGYSALLWHDNKPHEFRGSNPKLAHQAARVAMTAPLWPVWLLWAIGHYGGLLIGQLAIEATRERR